MIKYRKGYKYQLAEEYTIQIPITGYDICIDFISLTEKGWLTIEYGYAYDGASGIAKDDKYNLEGALVHDSLYQCMRHGVLPTELRQKCDDIMLDICKEKGMGKIRRWLYKRALKRFAGFAAEPKNKKKVYVIE